MALTRLGKFDGADMVGDSALEKLHQRRTERQASQSSSMEAEASMMRAEEYTTAGEATRAAGTAKQDVISGAPQVSLTKDSTPQDLVATFREQLTYYRNAGMLDEADRLAKGLNDLQTRINAKSKADKAALPKPPPTGLEDASARDTSRNYYDQAFIGITGAQFEADEDGENVAAIPVNRESDEYALTAYHKMMQTPGMTQSRADKALGDAFTIIASSFEEQVIVPNAFIKGSRQQTEGIDDETIADLWVNHRKKERPQAGGEFIAPPEMKPEPKPYESPEAQVAREGREKAQAGASREAQEAYQKWKEAGEGREYFLTEREIGLAYSVASEADKPKLLKILQVKAGQKQNGR